MSTDSFPASSQFGTDNHDIQITEQLMSQSQNYKKLLGFVLEWTGREPLLTQILFKMMLETDRPPIAGEEAKWVDGLIRSRLLKVWDTEPQLKPLQMLRDRLTSQRDKRKSLSLLRYYLKVLRQEEVFADSSPEQKELRLLGLIAKQRGRVQVHNRIYETIFNEDWVSTEIKKLEASLGPDDEEFLRIFEELERTLLTSQSRIIARIENGEEKVNANQLIHEVLREVTSKIGELVGADRTSIFLLNDERTELWSLVAEDATGQLLDIRVRVGEGIAGAVAKHKQVIHIPDNVYDDPRSRLVQESDQKYNYYTRNILAFPILNDALDLIAVVQLLNKITKTGEATGFSHRDLEQLAKCVIPIRRILESCQSSYEAIKRAQASAALAKATRSLDQVNLDTSMILQRVMDAAKELLNADRSTLWLYDDKRGDLWTRLPKEGVIRCPVGIGFAGQVAQSREPMVIGYDLYEDPNAENAKKTDAQTHYRTCSLLCMPILSPDGQFLGVSQLINKRKPGYEGETYQKAQYPKVPPFFKASFDRNDRQSMQVFNERVGAILQFAKTHETLKESNAQGDTQDILEQALILLGNAIDPDAGDGQYDAFYGVLRGLGLALQRKFAAEHSHIFLIDRPRQELWTLVIDPKRKCPRELRMSARQGIALRVLASAEAKKSNKAAQLPDNLVRIGLRRSQLSSLQSVLLLPVFDADNMPVAIVRLLNHESGRGFSRQDSESLTAISPTLMPILQTVQTLSQSLNRPAA
ncbi:GAF domain-containing protein [Spirulina major CS-329]|uniref:GAF domain-containing protein n=1 Tax=Spirulina TaxID=1154 RepID=UPI00232AB932|nr:MULTISPECIES: GAF domain-containing protein [Spirulina]MDB9495850.1 GAF domain-containing protein [Spirulina subsalsa CS-330]MDB9504662.1 GAF domain-containing protein [Spirulina major CS-329]